MAEFSGHLFDGHSAVRRDVGVSIDASGLEIRDENGRWIAQWDYENLRLAAAPRGTRPLRLASLDAPEARLVIDDSRILESLAESAPNLRKGVNPQGYLRRRAAIVAGAAVALMLVFAFMIPRFAGPLAIFVPVAWEEALGRQVADLVEFQFDYCEAARGHAAMEGLMNRLASVTDAPYDFAVHVLDVDAVNAFATPGGRIYVFKGLLEKAESADEVAGVLAHEIGHVVHRHSTEATIRQLGFSMILQGLVGEGSNLIGLAADVGTLIVELSYSREAEAEADETAVDILNAADLNGDGLARFFERVAEMEEESDVPDFGAYLLSHPAPAERKAAVLARSGRGRAAALTASEWEAARAICEK